MKPSKFKMAALASAILMCAAGSAQAGSYAVAYLNIQNFAIVVDPALGQFANSVDSSTASAILNGVGAGPNGGTGISDAAIAVRGTTVPPVFNNSQFGGGLAITPIGKTGQTDYSYADALITHNVNGTFNAQTIAESHLANPGTASALAENKSSTGFSTVVNAASGAIINFDFTADPRISLFLQTNGAIGTFATGSTSAKLTMTCTNAGGCGTTAGGVAIADGAIVFSWQPNGVVGGTAGVDGVVGGNETADGENLNVGRTLNGPPGGSTDFSPAALLANFHAMTNPLGAGVYTLQLDMNSSDGVIKAAAVPEPGTIALLGLGLGGLAMTSRRRKV